MVSINPVFSVLVASANSVILAAGSTPDQLAPGQLGFFSYQTGLSIDTTNVAQNKNFYIAVGLDPASTGSTVDINRSAGNNIEQRGIKAFTNKPYVAPVNKKMVVNVGKVNCNSEYAIKLEIHDQREYATYGYNAPKLTFSTVTSLCADNCTDCGAGDPNDVVAGLAAELALDPNGLFTTRFLDPRDGSVITNLPQWREGVSDSLIPPAGTPTGTPTTGTGATAAGTYRAKITALSATGESLPSNETAAVVLSATGEIAWAWTASAGATSYRIYVTSGATGTESTYFTSATNSFTQIATTGTAGTPPTGIVADAPNANAGITAQLEITVLLDALVSYAQINLNYFDPRGVDAYLSFVEGFGTDSTQAITQALVYEDGTGYDIVHQEYIALGWKGSPYRLSNVGVPTVQFPYYATNAGTYQVFTITNENSGVGGSARYQASMRTVIAVPSANTTALNSINAALQRIVNAASGNDSTVNAAFPVATSYTVEFE